MCEPPQKKAKNTCDAAQLADQATADAIAWLRDESHEVPKRKEMLVVADLLEKHPTRGDQQTWFGLCKSMGVSRQTKNMETSKWDNRPLPDIKRDIRDAFVRHIKTAQAVTGADDSAQSNAQSFGEHVSSSASQQAAHESTVQTDAQTVPGPAPKKQRVDLTCYFSAMQAGVSPKDIRENIANPNQDGSSTRSGADVASASSAAQRATRQTSEKAATSPLKPGLEAELVECEEWLRKEGKHPETLAIVEELWNENLTRKAGRWMRKQLNITCTREQETDMTALRERCLREVLALVDRYRTPFFSKMPLPAGGSPPADSAPSNAPAAQEPFGEYWWLLDVRKASRSLQDSESDFLAVVAQDDVAKVRLQLRQLSARLNTAKLKKMIPANEVRLKHVRTKYWYQTEGALQSKAHWADTSWIHYALSKDALCQLEKLSKEAALEQPASLKITSDAFMTMCRSTTDRPMSPFMANMEDWKIRPDLNTSHCIRHLALIELKGYKYQMLPLEHERLLEIITQARQERAQQAIPGIMKTEEEFFNEVVEQLEIFIGSPDNVFANRRFLALKEWDATVVRQTLLDMVERCGQCMKDARIDIAEFSRDAAHFATLSVLWRLLDKPQVQTRMTHWSCVLAAHKLYVPAEDVHGNDFLASHCPDPHAHQSGVREQPALQEGPGQAVATAPVVCELCGKGFCGRDAVRLWCSDAVR